MRLSSLFLALASGLASATAGSFENSKYSQTYDLAGSYVKKSVQLDIKNVGKEPASEYLYTVDKDLAPHVAITEVRVLGADTVVPYTEEEGEDSFVYRLTIPPLEPGQEASLILAQAITGLLKPLPEFAGQNDHQYLSFNTSRYPLSPYVTKEAVTKIRTLARTYEEVDPASDADEPKISDTIVEYGPYKDLEPYSYRQLIARFENPKPMVKASRLDRDVWVSHWGSSISFEETYWIVNIGTKLRDTFSRLDFLRGQGTLSLNLASIRELLLNVGGNARDAYYTDLVGNVSTSNFRSQEGRSVFQLKPRYPVFGGWKYNFTIGWSNDLKDYVKTTGTSQYLLRVPTIEGPEDIYYDNVNLNIILPEGADDIKVLSMSGEELNEDLTFSYLDTVGRPTIRLHYSNILDSHKRGDLYVSYSYATSAALRKPLMIASAFATLFSVLLVLSKVDISISKQKKD